jgi:ATP-dependent DNA ligase
LVVGSNPTRPTAKRGRCAIRDAKRIAAAAKAHPAAIFAFDLLELEGKDIRSVPLLRRKALLQRELRRSHRICCCQHVGEIGERQFQKAEELGLEGIIAKKADSPTVGT